MISPKLLSLPVFLGISQSDLTEIMGYTRFDFKKIPEGKAIVKSGQPCKGLIFVLSGTVTAITANADRSFLVHETINAPIMMQPERAFGMNQQYSSTFVAQNLCHTMSISKTELIKLYNGYDVVRINLLNLFANRLQRADDANWRTATKNLRSRLLHYLRQHCLHPAGEKLIHTTMNSLAAELNDSRLNVSIELNALQREGLLELSRSRIRIPAFERLFV